ncbi:MAG: amidohydrolase family protein [Planctomycetota bacterium]
MLITNLTSFADDQVPGAPQDQPILIQNCTIHPVTSKPIKGAMLFENGKIIQIGKKIKPPKNALVIDAQGKHVYPGLFETHSQIGLTELAAVRATNDFRESGSINPNVKALVSIYPDNMNIPVTRSNGVLFAVVAPTGGLISGKSAVVQLDGWTYEDMSIRNEATLQVNWPSMSISNRRRARMTEKEIADAEKRRKLQLIQIREYFDAAKRYRDARASDDSNQRYDARLEAMIEVVDGQLPLMVRADRAAEIQSAVAFGAEQGINIIILGGYDAEMCADVLKKNKVPVIVSAVHRNPQRRDDGYDRAYDLPARLHKAGVQFCISGTDRSETWNARNLAYQAGHAVGFGLPEEEALKSITIHAATILGVDDRIGSLEVGKDASFIVTDGNPMETTTEIHAAYLQGRSVDLNNRQKRLYKKYQQKYEQLQRASDKE